MHRFLVPSLLSCVAMLLVLVAGCGDEPSGGGPSDTSGADQNADQHDVSTSEVPDAPTELDAEQDTEDATPDITATDTATDQGPIGPLSGPSIVLTIYETQPEPDTVIGLFTPDTQGFDHVAMCWAGNLCFETWPAAGQSADWGALDAAGMHTFLDVGPAVTFGGVEGTIDPNGFPPAYIGNGEVAEGTELGLTLSGGVLGDYTNTAALQRPAALRLLEPIPTDFWDYTTRPADGQVTVRWEPGGPGEVYLAANVRTYRWIETARGRLFHLEDTGTFTLDIASLPNIGDLTPSATPVDYVELILFRLTTSTVEVNEVEIQLAARTQARWNFYVQPAGN